MAKTSEQNKHNKADRSHDSNKDKFEPLPLYAPQDDPAMWQAWLDYQASLEESDTEQEPSKRGECTMQM